MAHHKLGPSAAHRWLNCPGSVAATADLEDSGSIYAAEGSAAHAVAERVLTGSGTLDNCLGDSVEIDQYTIDVDQEMVTAVGAYLDRLAELGGGDISVEAELDLGEFIPDGFGTADHIHISGSRLTVTDLKYGKGVRVDAEHNPQLKLYGVGALAAFDHLYDIETVVLRIDQPRIDHVSEWEISADELWTWGTDVVAPAAKLATGQNAPRVPGKVQCKWCLAKATCPELQKAAAGTSAYRPVTELEAKELGEALELVDLVTDWAKAVEARAFELMTGGLEVPGYKLVHGRARRDWADTKAAEAKLRRLLKVDGAMPRKLISPAQAQKALGKNWDKVADLVAVQSGKPTIASADDKRQAISPAESLGFADLNDSE